MNAVESTDCGPAALATVVRSHGGHVALRTVRRMVAPGREGTDLATLRSVAEELGFEATAGRIAASTLGRIPLPAIAHLRGKLAGHFVVVHRVDSRWVLIADPSRGLRRMNLNVFCAEWTGHVLLLKPTPSLRSDGGADSSPSSLGLFGLATEHLPLVAGGLAFAVLLTGAGLTTAFLTKSLLEGLISAPVTVPTAVASALAALALGRGGMMVGRSFVVGQLGHAIEARVGRLFIFHLLRLPLSYFDQRLTGELFARLLDLGIVRNAVSAALITTMLDMGTLLLACAVLVAVDVGLAMIVLSVVPLMLVCTALVLPALRMRDCEARSRFGVLASESMELLGAIRSIKSFRREDAFSRRWHERFEAFMAEKRRREQFNGLVQGAFGGVVGLPLSAVLFWGGLRVGSGQLAFGELIFFSSIVGFVSLSASQIHGAVTLWQEATLALARVSDVLDETSDAVPAHDGTAPTVALRGDYLCRDVSFGYRRDMAAVANVSLEIKSGSTTAIVGETGSGKSTLALLLSGLYRPSAGELLIDGRPLTGSDAGRRGGIALVSQDPGLIDGSVAENVAFGYPGLTPDQIDECLRLASADAFVDKLAGGAAAEIGSRGGRLSTGERQRVALARALACSPAVLILDEATSNLDVATEGRVLSAVRGRFPHVTLILITHRQHLAATADRVIVMKDGCCVSSGSHQELQVSCPVYRRLCTGATKPTAQVDGGMREMIGSA